MSKPDQETKEFVDGVGGNEGVTTGAVESTTNAESETSDAVRPTLSVAVSFTRTFWESNAGGFQRYVPVFGSPVAIETQSVHPFELYERAIGESAKFVSETAEGFHVIEIPVPVDPFRNSHPFGERSALEETAGFVESTTNETDQLAEFERRSVAVRRIFAFAELWLGTIQEAFQEFTTAEAT